MKLPGECHSVMTCGLHMYTHTATQEHLPTHPHRRSYTVRQRLTDVARSHILQGTLKCKPVEAALSTEAGGPKVRSQSAETSADGRRTGHNRQRSRFPFLNTLRKGLASLNSSGDPEEGRATLRDPASKFHIKDTLILGESHNNEFSEKSAWKTGTVAVLVRF